ncbi:MAG: hypothetical protein IKB43_12495 [Fibrobacter sp.]|nr:hypothetical protein [Fibrobacter sp.]MBR2470941.1 hypothetical protein [Fibrobacter sp.]
MNRLIPLFAIFFLLSACAGTAPAPAAVDSGDATKPAAEPATEPAVNSTTSSAMSSAPATTSSQQGQQSAVMFNSQQLDNYRLSTPENIPGVETSSAQFGADQTGVSSMSQPSVSQPIDPYMAFPALVDEVFAFADSLYRAGYTDSATAYLERFRVIKPLWLQWERRADSLLNEFGKTRAEKSKQFDPMVLKIQNMNRAQSAYSLVAETADSLIALSPGDSLVAWAGEQKKQAYANTLQKARRELSEIRVLAEGHAEFNAAQAKLKEFQLRYRDFEDSLQTAALAARIAELAAVADSVAKDYWAKHDPAQALAQADTLTRQEKFPQAKELLNKLMFSNLRQQALEKYNALADAYCNKQRKVTSQLFTKSQKQKDEQNKKSLLKDAIDSLDNCLVEYPDYSQKQKVLDNMEFLKKELAK